MIKLSVLDQSPVRSGGKPAQAIAQTIELAERAEQLGYHRYWLAEHHNSRGLACTAPEVLITRIASVTSSIRVGSGGVMLSHYSPLKVAETFRVLESLFPGRVDLGIGRAPGCDRVTSMALQNGVGMVQPEEFPSKVADLLGFLNGQLRDDHPFTNVHAMPTGIVSPPIWLLGSSDQSAMLAAHFGCAFSFAHFINDHGGPEIMNQYRRNVRPSSRLVKPECSIGVFVLCAETEAKAKRLGASRDLWRLRVDQGIMGPFPSVEEALDYPYTDQERAQVKRIQRRQIVGAPHQVREQLLNLCTAYNVEELVVLTICYEFADRLRSYELLAEVFETSR